MNLYSDEIIKEEKQESLNIVDTYAYFTETILDAHHIISYHSVAFIIMSWHNISCHIVS